MTIVNNETISKLIGKDITYGLDTDPISKELKELGITNLDTLKKIEKIISTNILYRHRLDTANEYIESHKDNMIPEHYNDLKYILNECDLESTW